MSSRTAPAWRGESPFPFNSLFLHLHSNLALLSHDSSYLGIHSKTPDNAKSITRNLRNLAVAAPLRSRYLYNNMLFTSLTHLIETKSGTSFSQYLSDRIFTSLSMTSTYLQPSSVPSTAAVATGHAWDKATSSYITFQSPDCPEGQGAGSIMTTSSDFILWVKALLRKDAPLSEKTVSNLTKLRSFVNPSSRRTKPFTSPPFYTAGMEATYYRGATQIGHDGNIPGFASRFSFLPDHDLGIAVLTNSSTGGAVASALIRELVDEVLGVAVNERPRPQMPNQKKANAKKQQMPVRPKDEETKPKRRTPKNPQEKPLEDYAGVYSNVGYHTMTVEIRDDELYVDATDRGMGFTLTFEHVRDQTEYKAHLSDALEAGDDVLDAEFVIEDGKVVRMGVDLEPAVRDLIWFDRV